MERCTIYTRVSGRGQDDNYSKGVQVEACTAFAKAQGWTVHSHVHDTQSGADFLTREDLQKAISMVRLGVSQYVLFSTVDRMSRAFVTFESLTQEIYKYKGKIAVADKGKVYDTYDAFWFDCITEVSEAVKERLKIKRRTGDARMKAFLEGSYMKRPPYGYTIQTVIRKIDGRKEKFNELLIVKPQQESIRAILEHYLESRSKTETTRWANDSKLYHSVEDTGEVCTFWNYSTIITLLEKSELYAGIPQVEKFRNSAPRKDKETGEYKEGPNPEITYTYPEIISVELAKEVTIAYGMSQKRSNPTIHPKPFNGHIFCTCGLNTGIIPASDMRNGAVMCASGKKVKAATKARQKHRHVDPCMYSLSPVFFIAAMKEYLESLDPDEFISQGELALLEMYETYQTLQSDIINVIHPEREQLVKTRSNIVRNAARLDPDEDKETLEAFNQEVKVIQLEIDALAERQREIEGRVAQIESLMRTLDMTLEEHPSFLGGNFTFTKVTPRLESARTAIGKLKDAVHGGDWEAVSYQMSLLGLRMVADFSIKGKKERRQSIRVLFSIEQEGETLPPTFSGTTTSTRAWPTCCS